MAQPRPKPDRLVLTGKNRNSGTVQLSLTVFPDFRTGSEDLKRVPTATYASFPFEPRLTVTVIAVSVGSSWRPVTIATLTPAVKKQPHALCLFNDFCSLLTFTAHRQWTSRALLQQATAGVVTALPAIIVVSGTIVTSTSGVKSASAIASVSTSLNRNQVMFFL